MKVNGTSPLVGMLRGVGVRIGVTMETVRASGAAQIFAGIHTLWWTHRLEDVAARPVTGQGLDPRGGEVAITQDVEGFLQRAVRLAESGQWGPHGVNAFLAAHAQNCRRGAKSWCFQSVEPYNTILSLGVCRARLDEHTCQHCSESTDLFAERAGSIPPHAGCTNPKGCRCWLEIPAVLPAELLR